MNSCTPQTFPPAEYSVDCYTMLQALGLEATMEAGLLNNYSITLQEESALVFLDATRVGA